MPRPENFVTKEALVSSSPFLILCLSESSISSHVCTPNRKLSNRRPNLRWLRLCRCSGRDVM
ncbi:hypothetical protein RchiOBHm_Chr3g0473241 [Rosa chinensis]|uniref:Uncharacterized protein n=1 Tax=Rosa chinensis TaxID=74649 RepID=A0A2P6RBT6_ROSCH|nr:hypothetical protein RchiOBHm_Chr3g0473241 [Rosa chinensis]